MKVQTATTLSPDRLAQAHELLDSAQLHDAIAPLSEQFINGLSDSRLKHQHFYLSTDEGLLALAAVDPTATPAAAEIVVDPKRRREGFATAILAEVRDLWPELDVWAHGTLAPAQAMAAELSAKNVRELLVMQLKEQLPAAEIPEGYTLLNLDESRERFGDFADREFLRVNNEAFAWHPEQGGWDQSRWERAQDADWFRSQGVLMLWGEGENALGVKDVDASTTLSGFHWTKLIEPKVASLQPLPGEIYVVGLSENSRGKGLGGPLILAGINYLQKLGSEHVILYVEADNKSATKAYEKLGFVVKESHSLYRLTP